MKTKKIKKSLNLTKETIANFKVDEMNGVKGGFTAYTCQYSCETCNTCLLSGFETCQVGCSPRISRDVDCPC